jgi:signal transduction histidine kinase
MNDEQKEPHADELRNVAVASILEVTSDFLYVDNLDALLQKIVKVVSETFGIAKVTIGIREKETDLFAVRAAHGFSPETEAQIRGVKYTLERMKTDLKPELRIGKNAYYVPAESWEPDEEDFLFIAKPERMDRARSSPNEWHEFDFVDLLMYERNGELLGYLEIDEPDDGKVPSEETIRAIEVFADLAAIAIQNASLYEKLEDDRRKIQLLIDLIGHDVNNYAQGVSGFIELAMSRPDVPQPARKSLAKAHDQVMNLNKLVRNVNIYAKVEFAGDKNIHPMDVATTVEEAFSAAQSSSPSREVKMVLKDDGKEKLSQMNELAKDIFLNLFSNAVKFDEHEKIVIDVDIEGRTMDKVDCWCVSVADHGPGIDDCIKDKIFDRFTQGPSTSIGTGLGLYIAKALVEIYKGKIWVEDRVEGDRSKGSVFKVMLPKYTGWMPRSDTQRQ